MNPEDNVSLNTLKQEIDILKDGLQRVSDSMFQESDLSLEDKFSYHPPLTESRIQAHEEWNSKCLELVQVLDRLVKYSLTSKEQCATLIQQARMIGNSAITYDELLVLGFMNKNT